MVGLEIGGGGIVEDQIDIEAEQIGRLEKDLALDPVRPDGEEVERAVKLIDGDPPSRARSPGGIGQKGDIGRSCPRFRLRSRWNGR